MVVGALVTMIIQSSATTVMVVGFVMPAYDADSSCRVIMGANIGTTVTAQIASLNLDNCLIAVGIGVGIWLFEKQKNKVCRSPFRIWYSFIE